MFVCKLLQVTLGSALWEPLASRISAANIHGVFIPGETLIPTAALPVVGKVTYFHLYTAGN